MSKTSLPSIGDFDLLNDDVSITEYVQPYCVALNHSGTRLGVGTEQGFRVFALTPILTTANNAPPAEAPLDHRRAARGQTGSAVPARTINNTTAASSAPPQVQWVEAYRYPPLPHTDDADDEEDSDDGFVFLSSEFDDVKGAGDGQALPRPSASVDITGRSASVTEGGGEVALPPPLGVGSISFLSDTQVVCGGGGARPICKLNSVLFFSGASRLVEVSFSDAVRQICLSSEFVLALTQTSVEIRDYQGALLFHEIAYGGLLPSAPSPLGFHALHRLIAFPTVKQKVSYHHAHPSASVPTQRYPPQPAEDATVGSPTPNLGSPLQSPSPTTTMSGNSATFSPPLTSAAGAAGVTSSPPSSSVSSVSIEGFGFTVLHFPERIASAMFARSTAQQAIAGESPFDVQRLAVVPEAHKTRLTSISFNVDGSLLATSSERGTLLRVWASNRSSVVPMRELRIGSLPLSSSSIQTCFIGTLYLCCLHGMKVKIFYVGMEEQESGGGNKQGGGVTHAGNNNKDAAQWWNEQLQKNQHSRFSQLGYLSTYFQSEWAVRETELPSSHVPQSILLSQLLRQEQQQSQHPHSLTAGLTASAFSATASSSSSPSSGLASMITNTSLGALSALRSSLYLGGPSTTSSSSNSTPAPTDGSSQQKQPTAAATQGSWFGMLSYYATTTTTAPKAIAADSTTTTPSPSVATTSSSHPHPRKTELSYFVPSTTEELSVIWWAQPTERQWAIDGSTRGRSTGTTPRAGTTGTTASNAATSFFVSNCDGALLQLRFHPLDGRIETIVMPNASFRSAAGKPLKLNK